MGRKYSYKPVQFRNILCQSVSLPFLVAATVFEFSFCLFDHCILDKPCQTKKNDLQQQVIIHSLFRW